MTEKERIRRIAGKPKYDISPVISVGKKDSRGKVSRSEKGEKGV